MARMTKTQQKRLVRAIQSKTKILFTVRTPGNEFPATVKDMETIDKLCTKWLKRIG